MKMRQIQYSVLVGVLWLSSCALSLLMCQTPAGKQGNKPDTKHDAAKKQETGRLVVQPKVDSLPPKPEKVVVAPKEDLLMVVDSLNGEVNSLKKRLERCNEDRQDYVEKIEALKSKLRLFYAVPGNEAKIVKQDANAYTCYKVDLSTSDLQFYWKDEKTKQPIRSLKNLAQIVEKGKKVLVFATNGGMYKSDNSPQGLLVQQGKTLAPIDKRKEEYGNFYLQPNGVFFIDTNNVASILKTEEFSSRFEGKSSQKVKFATQSGPMVVVNGVINTVFKVDSDNLNIRSGVGILDSSHVVFIISNKPVNFYDFARLFLEEFKCKNALYLDGAISKMYLPELGRLEDEGNFGPIIGITKK